jgi:hypothetical protein
MRDVIMGGGGLVLGGVLGAGGLLGIELLIAGVVAGTLWMTAVPEPSLAPPVATPVAAAAAVAPRARPQPVVEGPPGEVQVLTMAAVQASLDGAPMPFDTAQGYVLSVPPGRHRLQITDAFGRITADTEVEVTSGRRAQLRYAKGALTDLGAMPQPGTGTPPAPQEAATAPVVAPVVDADLTLEVTTPVEPKVTLGAGPSAVEIKLPKIGIGRK